MEAVTTRVSTLEARSCAAVALVMIYSLISARVVWKVGVWSVKRGGQLALRHSHVVSSNKLALPTTPAPALGEVTCTYIPCM